MEYAIRRNSFQGPSRGIRSAAILGRHLENGGRGIVAEEEWGAPPEPVRQFFDCLTLTHCLLRRNEAKPRIRSVLESASPGRATIASAGHRPTPSGAPMAASKYRPLPARLTVRLS